MTDEPESDPESPQRRFASSRERDEERLSRRRLDELIERNLPALQAFVRLRLGPLVAARESSSDIVQSVCRELIEDQRIEYRGEEALRGWLFTAALHKIRQKARLHGAGKRDVRREVAAGDAQDDAALLDCCASLMTPSRDAAAREEVARLEQAIAALSEEDRTVITLARVAGLGHEEIARQTGWTVQASRTRLRRALVRLAAILEPGC